MKKLILILPLILIACKSEPEFNTEIFCPNKGYKILIKKSTIEEVENAIANSVEYQKRSNQNNNFTVLYLPDGRNTSIQHIKAHELYQCELIERSRKPILLQ